MNGWFSDTRRSALARTRGGVARRAKKVRYAQERVSADTRSVARRAKKMRYAQERASADTRRRGV